MRSLRLGCAIGALMVASTAVYAQETTGTIRGDVLDSSGNPVPNATVTILHQPSGSRSTSTTGADGSFNASGLRVGGPYQITVAAPGLESASETIPSIALGTPQRVDVTLFSAAETITVTGSRTSTITLATGPQTTLDSEDIAGVASIARDVRDIARRDPFVTIDQSNSRTIEIAGQNGRLNRFSVDGVQFSDDFGLNNGGLPTSRGPVPFDAIEQLSVSIAPFDVQEGDFQGGAVNVVLRSGDNDFTGSAFFTYTDDSLTGDRVRGTDINLKFDSKQYGAFLAGPIIKDKLFFAFAYEKTEESDPVDDGPTGLGFANSIPRVTQALLDQVTGISNTVYQYDPLGILQNAVEQDEKYTAKIDWNINDDHRASLTYIHNEGSQQFTQNSSVTNTSPTFGFRSNGYELVEEFNSGVFQVNSSWSDNFSTELRVSYKDINRDQTPFGGRDFAQFEVCTDPASINSGTNTLTTCTQAVPATNTLAAPRLFFGPDISRQANDLNTENLSVDFSAELEAGIHTFKGIVEYTDIDVFNLFLQRATGDYYFDSIADLQARRASRVRLGGAVPSGDVDDAAARFSTQNYTFGLQDQIDIGDDIELSLGLRYDLFGSDSSVPLNTNFLARYGFANTKTFKGEGVLQPRFGANWQVSDRLVLRGGVGLFAGGTPDVFLSNSYSNTGQLTNAIDISRNTSAAGCNVSIAGATPAQLLSFCNAALLNVNGRTFDPQVLNFLQTNTASLAAAPVNAVDPDFDLPSQWRATLSASYEADFGFLGDGWLLGADFVYGEAHRAITYVDLRSVPIASTLPDGRQRYNAFNGTATTNQDLLLTNDNRGRSILAVARVAKEWDFGLSADLSYTWQDIEDVNAITSATAGSLYGNTVFADPNNAAYGTSIYEIRNSVKGTLDFKRNFFGENQTRFTLFGEYRSGRPYSFTFRDPASGRSPVFGTNGNSSRYLIYVPAANDPLVSFDSVATQTAFNNFVDGGKLAGFRGQIAPKNIARSPSFFKVDLHVEQELPVPLWGDAKFKLFADMENVLNFIDSDWGAQRQVVFPYNAALVNVQCLVTPVATGTPVGNVGAAPPAGGVAAAATLPTQACAQYRYSSFAEPSVQLQNQNRQSLYGIRVGVRFEF
jgi:hypothetical protein